MGRDMQRRSAKVFLMTVCMAFLIAALAIGVYFITQAAQAREVNELIARVSQVQLEIERGSEPEFIQQLAVARGVGVEIEGKMYHLSLERLDSPVCEGLARRGLEQGPGILFEIAVNSKPVRTLHQMIEQCSKGENLISMSHFLEFAVDPMPMGGIALMQRQ